MALVALRLRRAASLSTSLLRLHPLSPATPSPLSPFTTTHPNPSHVTPLQSRHFISSPPSLSSARSSFRDNNNSFGEEIGPDTILFEGCDYNHWLITMDFPKDPAPTREEMIETYLQTLAKVVGSYEEAKKKMYACSTTTYQGFQCLVSEEESEKFKGDKYDNGVITPRPPPVQYGRQGGRYGDRNRDFNRNPRQMQNEQGNRGYDNQGPRYGDNRNFGQQPNPSVPNQQGNQGYHNQGPRFADNRNFGQHQNPSVPNQQGNQLYDNQGPRYGDNRNFERQQNPSVLNQQGNRGYDNQGPYGDVRNSGQLRTPSVQPNYGPIGGERRNPLPMNNTPGRRDTIPPYQGNNYDQNQQENYNPQGVVRAQPEQRGYSGDNRNYAPLQGVTQGQGAGGNYGQMGGGNGQESGGNYGQMSGGNYGQGAGGNHSQGFQYQQMERRNNDEGGQRNFGQMGQSGTDQGRY